MLILLTIVHKFANIEFSGIWWAIAFIVDSALLFELVS